MSQQTSIVQRMLKRNAAEITWIHSRLVYYKAQKANSDFIGDVTGEYYYHNAVKDAKKLIKDYVAEQKMLKKLLKQLNKGTK